MHTFSKHSRRRYLGFTLLELLVVISIISLFASIILVSLQSARTAAFDNSQVQAEEQVRIAINSYYNDHNAYPPVPYAEDSSGNISVGTPTIFGSDNFGVQLFPLLISGHYMSSSPGSAFYRTSQDVDNFIYTHWCDTQTPCNPNDITVQFQFNALTRTCASRPIAAFVFTLKATNQFKADCFY